MKLSRPVWILHVFVVGLALHNLAMAELWAAGVRGTALDVVSAWKEALLALGLLLVLRNRGWRIGRPSAVDWLALAYAAILVVWAIVPQHVLGGAATHRGVILGVRHDGLPVATYLFGRGLELTARDVRRLGATIIASAVGVAAFGLVDIYAIPLSWWRQSGAPGWFSQQLGFGYQGLSNLPENFIYNTGNEHPLRRLVSFFLSPLATSYLLVTALLLCAAWRVRLRPRLGIWLPTTLLLLAALLWTHSRSSYLALALGLVVFAAIRHRQAVPLVAAAAAVVVVGLLFVKAYPHVAPSTTFTAAELKVQRANAHKPGAGSAVNGLEDASTRSHLRNLRDGIRTVVHHPQGYGPGNAGSTAERTCGTCIKAGESTYTELGVDTGLAGGVLFAAWSLAVLVGLARCRAAWLTAALVAMLALGLQTDIIGVPWVVYTLWPLAGWQLSHREA